MQNQIFPDREIGHDRAVNVVPRGSIVVPLHHTQNLRSVFGSTSVRQQTVRSIDGISPAPLDLARPTQLNRSRVSQDVFRPAEQPNLRPQPQPVVVNTNNSVQPVAKQIVETAPKVIQNATSKSEVKPDFDKKAVKQATKIARKQQKATAKEEKLAARAEKAQLRKKQKTDSKQSKVSEHKPVKSSENRAASTASASTPKPKTASTDSNKFTSQVLASAASTISLNGLNSSSVALDNAGMAAVADVGQTNNGIVNFPKIAVEFNINRRRVMTFLKTLFILAVLAVVGLLVWDILVANQNINGTFSNNSAVNATALDSSNPMNVDPVSISNQAWEAYTAPANQPRYVYLDSIGIKARVTSVGINSDGNMDSPANANDTGWYDGSAKPGNDGQVFINGHTSFSSTFKAAFDKLPELAVGDTVSIERGDGERINYKVVSNQTVSTDEIDMKKALSTPDGAKQGLTLMTYTGEYNYRTKTADKRVIVYAVRE